MATCVTPSSANQSANSSRSAVMVPKVRVWRCTLPLAVTRRTQATTVSLWTSRPAQAEWRMSMADSRRPGPGRQRADEQSALRALPRGMRQFRVRGAVRVRLTRGLKAPREYRPRPGPGQRLAYPRLSLFSWFLGVAQRHDD